MPPCRIASHLTLGADATGRPHVDGVGPRPEVMSEKRMTESGTAAGQPHRSRWHPPARSEPLRRSLELLDETGSAAAASTCRRPALPG